MKIAIVTDEPRKVLSARSPKSMRGFHVDKVILVKSKDFKLSEEAERDIKLMVHRSKGEIVEFTSS